MRPHELRGAVAAHPHAPDPRTDKTAAIHAHDRLGQPLPSTSPARGARPAQPCACCCHTALAMLHSCMILKTRTWPSLLKNGLSHRVFAVLVCRTNSSHIAT